MKRISVRRLVMTLAVGLLGGCTILAPQSDSSRFFVLAPLPTADHQEAADSAALPSMTLGLGPIRIPAYLDRNEVATQLSSTQISYSPVNRWAEPLDVSIARVLVQNLSGLLGTERIVRYPWSNATAVDYQILLEVLRFDTDETGEAHLSVRWAVQTGKTRRVAVVRQTKLTQPPAMGNDPAASVTALSATLAALSEEIAATVRGLPRIHGT